MMNKIQAKELLHDILNNGVAVDIFQAEQSLCLINLILKNSKEINESTFVILFRTLQFILTKLSNGMLSKALSALMTARDKVIAHSEAIQTLDLPKTTLEEAEQLLVFAKKFLGVVGMGYLSIAYEDSDGNHFLIQDAKRVSRAMERLLIKAGIIKQDKPSIP